MSLLAQPVLPEPTVRLNLRPYCLHDGHIQQVRRRGKAGHLLMRPLHSQGHIICPVKSGLA